MSRVISKLSKLLYEGETGEKIESYEDLIIEEIEKHVKDASFYSLPTEEIVRIIEKSSINDAKLLMELTGNMSNNKGKDAVLLLNVISSEEATFEECVKIISNFSKCPLLKRLGNLFNSDAILPERDYQYEIDELKKEIEKLKNLPKTSFPPVTMKPDDFVDDIHEAAKNGKLTSVQYLVEQCHANAEAKSKNEDTPLIGNYPKLFAWIITIVGAIGLILFAIPLFKPAVPELKKLSWPTWRVFLANSTRVFIFIIVLAGVFLLYEAFISAFLGFIEKTF